MIGLLRLTPTLCHLSQFVKFYSPKTTKGLQSFNLSEDCHEKSTKHQDCEDDDQDKVSPGDQVSPGQHSDHLGQAGHYQHHGLVALRHEDVWRVLFDQHDGPVTALGQKFEESLHTSSSDESLCEIFN